MKSKWETVKLKKLCSLSIDKEPVKEFDNYRLIGIRLWGQGLYERESIIGHSTQYKFFTKSKTGNLLFNKIWARNGAISVVQKQHNGLYVSPEFPVYSLNKDRVIHDWMYYYTKYYKLWGFCNEKSRGTSGKNRIKPESFLDIQIPLPPLSEQKRIVKIIKSVEEKIQQIKQLQEEQELDYKNFLFSTFEDLKKEYSIRPLSKSLEIDIDAEEVNPTKEYMFAGVYGFGKGIFRRGIQNGETSYKAFNILHKDHIILSKVKGWEGAIALITDEFEGLYLSPVYPTFKAKENININYVALYLKLPTVWQMLLDKSKGIGARRNQISEISFLELEIPLPPIEKQNKIVAVFDKLAEAQNKKNETIKKLEELIPSHLDKAFKGELLDNKPT